MVEFLTVDDVVVFEPGIDQDKAQVMIDDATALAVLAAPCIGEDTFDNADAVKAVLRGAILRWNDSGSGALASQTVGPFGQTYDTRSDRRGMFWPSEIAQLRSLCATNGVYTLSMTGPVVADGYWSSTTEWVPYP